MKKPNNVDEHGVVVSFNLVLYVLFLYNLYFQFITVGNNFDFLSKLLLNVSRNKVKIFIELRVFFNCCLQDGIFRGFVSFYSIFDAFLIDGIYLLMRFINGCSDRARPYFLIGCTSGWTKKQDHLSNYLQILFWLNRNFDNTVKLV